MVAPSEISREEWSDEVRYQRPTSLTTVAPYLKPRCEFLPNFLVRQEHIEGSLHEDEAPSARKELTRGRATLVPATQCGAGTGPLLAGRCPRVLGSGTSREPWLAARSSVDSVKMLKPSSGL